MGKLEKVEKFTEKGKVDKLAALACDADKTVRIAAISGLGRYAERELALNTLVRMMEDPDADIRKAVVLALGEASGSYVETKLRYCLAHDKDEQVLAATRESLAKLKNS